MVLKGQVRWGLRSDHWVEQDSVISDDDKNGGMKLDYSELRREWKNWVKAIFQGVFIEME